MCDEIYNDKEFAESIRKIGRNPALKVIAYHINKNFVAILYSIG